MKKTICYFLVIIIGNILFLKFYFTQDIFKVLAFTGILSIAYILPKFVKSFVQLFIKSNPPENVMNSRTAAIDNGIIKKSNFISAVVLILLAAFHVVGYMNYFKFQSEDLSNKGIYSPAIVTDKKLETRAKNTSGYYIYYTYRYNGQIYKHNCLNDTINVGDTIVVKFSPNNPDYHLIMDNTF